MKPKITCVWLLVATVAGLATTTAPAADPSGWLGFRGDGTSSASAGPPRLDMTDQGNLAWRAPMPGRSVASPIIVGDLVITTSSSGQSGEQIHVTGVDLSSGDTRWEHSFRATGRPYCHPSSANSAPSPASDGDRVFAFFSSNDLVCLSIEGNLVWYRGLGYDYPKAGNDIGMASSPTIAEGVVVVQVQGQGDSFAAGIDAETGSNLWRIERPKSSNWTSPITIRRPDGSVEVVLQSGEEVIAVDVKTGKKKWQLNESRATTPSPTAAGDYLLLPGDDLHVLNVGESGSDPQTAWRDNRLSPSRASVSVSGNRIYVLAGTVLKAADIVSGELAWQKRLSGLGGMWATPLIAGRQIYLFDQEGVGKVIVDRDDEAEVVSEVDLGEPVLASPAVSDGRLVVRGENTLFCFE